MFIGNNVDLVTNFEKRRALDAPHGGPDHVMNTWKGIWQLLQLAKVDAHRAFFTNCFVGLVEGKAEGRHPAADDGAFRTVCWQFLQLQFQLLQPVAAVLLGARARDFLVDHVDALSAWRGRPVSSVTPDDPSAILRAPVATGSEVAFTFVVHPSMYVAKRHFEQRLRGVGDASLEAALVRRALDA